MSKRNRVGKVLANFSESQSGTAKDINRVIDIFKNSQCQIRPHFILTGSSGTGKSHIIQQLASAHDVGFVEINAAQLTKEGTAGNSLSKAMVPLGSSGSKPTICFVDEFDKLFISGNNNDSLAHETTNGVQNEFLKVLESDTASVFGQYGAFDRIQVDNVLFVFAGAFNGEQDLCIDRLRQLGIKTEFLGRVGLIFNTEPLTLDDMLKILNTSVILDDYMKLFVNEDRKDVVKTLSSYIEDNWESNTLGVRMINTLVHHYFITGKVPDKKSKKDNLRDKEFPSTMSLTN